MGSIADIVVYQKYSDMANPIAKKPSKIGEKSMCMLCYVMHVYVMLFYVMLCYACYVMCEFYPIAGNYKPFGINKIGQRIQHKMEGFTSLGEIHRGKKRSPQKSGILRRLY
jgi:hypothetical protein